MLQKMAKTLQLLVLLLLVIMQCRVYVDIGPNGKV